MRTSSVFITNSVYAWRTGSSRGDLSVQNRFLKRRSECPEPDREEEVRRDLTRFTRMGNLRGVCGLFREDAGSGFCRLFSETVFPGK
jgi:hypothetical protein